MQRNRTIPVEQYPPTQIPTNRAEPKPCTDWANILIVGALGRQAAVFLFVAPGRRQLEPALSGVVATFVLCRTF